jgi:hypothetical protein
MPLLNDLHDQNGMPQRFATVTLKYGGEGLENSAFR